MKKIAFIFDMDGVIVDSIPWHWRVWKEFLTKHGKNTSRTFFDNNINGRRGEEIFKKLFGSSTTKAQHQKLDKRREQRFRQLFAPHCKLLPGLERFLQAARSAKIPMALATSAPPENLRLVLRRTGVGKYFEYIVDASGVKRGKPAPDMFLKAAKKLKAQPKDCIVFEDAILGVKAARAAKMRVVALTTSYNKKTAPRGEAVC
jgi:beta-phosphoglucomutase family hydrolase